jgi:hypothetical protein
VRELNTTERLLLVAKSVFTSPVSLAVWVAGGALFLFGWWWALLLALGAQGLLLMKALYDEDYLRRVFARRHEREDRQAESRIEEQLERIDFETRQRIRYILQLRKEMAREARGADVESYARKDLEKIASQLTPLVEQAVRLGSRKQQLVKYLQNVDERSLKSYVNSLRMKIEACADPVEREQLEQALRAREAEAQTYETINRAARRIDSQLENVEATFASWKAKIIRIKTADMTSAASVSEGLYSELDELSRQIDVLDTSVNEALQAETLTLGQQTG